MREKGGTFKSSWLDLPLLIKVQLLSPRNKTSALRDVRRTEQETNEKKPYASEIGDQLSRESSERFAFGKNRIEHGLSGWHSVSTTEKYVPLRGRLVYWVAKRREAENKISASISVRREPD